jgi:zinc transport system ATP-binding protein
MVSHDIQAALDNADKILHLDNTLLFFGTPDEYIKSEIGLKFIGGKRND